MKTEVYGAVAAVVAILFSVILWFQFLAVQPFTIASGINTAIIWAIGVIILSIASGLIGYLSELFKAALQMDTDTIDIFDMLGVIISFLVTIIIWFTFLATPANFTVVGILNTAVTWIVIVIIISLVAILIDFLRTKFFDYLPKPEVAAKALSSKK